MKDRRKKVRVNTISQSPIPTSAGCGIGRMVEMMEYVEKITMQNLYNDGGYSSMLPQMYV